MIKSVERQIAEQVIDVLVTAGFKLTVNDGGDDVVIASTDSETICAAMASTDEDYINALRADGQHGWIHFIYGNEPENVISDYSTQLEEILAPVFKAIDEYELRKSI